MSDRLTLCLRGWDSIDERHHHVTISASPTEFWRSLTPSQTMRLLQCAPRVVSHWRRLYPEPQYGAARKRPDGSAAAIIFGRWNGPGDQRRWETYTDDGMPIARGECTSFDIACDAADAELRAAGFILCDTESEE
jgi:hypothetical protein